MLMLESDHQAQSGTLRPWHHSRCEALSGYCTPSNRPVPVSAHILQPDRNVWRLTRSGRAAVLIDAGR